MALIRGVRGVIGAYSETDLIKEFYRVKKALGRVPNLTELGRIGRHSQRIYQKKFGRYNDFLARLGEKKEAQVRTKNKASDSRRILRKTFSDQVKKLGRLPRIEEIEVWSVDEFNDALESIGGWKLFVEEMKTKMGIKMVGNQMIRDSNNYYGR